MATCSFEGCIRPHYAKGLCNTHWARSRRGHDLSRSFLRAEWPWEDRLWKRVERAGPDDCWLFTGSRTKGYGAFSIQGVQTYAHRASYMLTHGPIPTGKYVCHRCDTPLCVNPAHLFLGSPKENVDDCIAKGRKSRGEHSPSALLRDADIPAIRARLASGERHERIADDYGVSRTTITLINTGSTWKHVGASA